MVDNYNEFKKWLTKKAMIIEEIDVSSTIELLIKFEEEQFKKEKEKEIKEIICNEVWKSTGILIEDRKIDNIYIKLKERSLIK